MKPSLVRWIMNCKTAHQRANDISQFHEQTSSRTLSIRSLDINQKHPNLFDLNATWHYIHVLDHMPRNVIINGLSWNCHWNLNTSLSPLWNGVGSIHFYHFYWSDDKILCAILSHTIKVFTLTVNLLLWGQIRTEKHLPVNGQSSYTEY